MENDDEKFFKKDEVATVSSNTGQVKYGLVLTANRPRSETEFKKTAYKNHNEIKVIWHPKGAEEIISDDKVVLMDRSLMPGDVVRKFSEGKPSQFGYCENIDIYATVKILNTNKIIENINFRNFTHTKPFAIHSSVFYESCVGEVYDVKRKVTFVSQNGSIFTLEDPNRRDFISLSTSDSFSIDDNVFYHGQKLKICLDSLEKAKFLKISNLMKCLLHNYKKNFSYKFGSQWVKVYVQDVIVSSVEVHWYCQTSIRINLHETYWPERLFTGDNLKKLKTIDQFESCSIHVGDTYWYTIKYTDNLMTMKQWRSKCAEAFNIGTCSIHSKTNKKKHHNKLLGTNQPSKSSHPIELDPINKDDLLLSNSCVQTLKSNRVKRNRMRKSLIKKSKQFNIPKVKTKPNSKVVVEICYTKSMVDVTWQDGTKETGVSSTDLYPVKTLGDLEFFPGNFVTEKSPATDIYGVVESVDHAERTAHVQWFKVYPEYPSLPYPIKKTYFSVYDLRHHPNVQFKSGYLVIHINPDTNPDLNTLTAGQVLSAGPDGKILVMWVNGEKTICWPQELYVVKVNGGGFIFEDLEYGLSEDLMSMTSPGPSKVECCTREYGIKLNGEGISFQDVEYDIYTDWMSLTGPGSSNKSSEQLHDEQEYARLLGQLLEQSVTTIKLFLDAVKQNCDMDKVLKLKKALEQYRLGFNLSSLWPTSECKEKEKEIETCYKDLMDNISKLINKIISRIDIKDKEERELVEEGELPYEIFIKDSETKLKQFVSDFIMKVYLVLKESYCSKYGIITDCDTKDESDDLRPEIMDVTEPASVLPVIKPHPAECRFITLDTEPVYEVTKPEYNQSITKPEEAGDCDTKDESDDLRPEIMDVTEPASVLPVIKPHPAECRFITLDTEPVYEVTKPEYNQSITKPEEAGVFDVVETLMDNSHKYINDTDNLNLSLPKVIAKDIQILQKSLPAGIWVKTFENRVDLFSIMIRGPEKTPYAGGLFLFDVKIPPTYPNQPPLCHYYSYCVDRLNPNLYEDGKVCLSLLGTWSGQGVELWSPNNSNLLQLLLSIQGLILVSEPYYNEPGFDSQRGQKLAKENSRVYNEMALIKVVQSMTNMLNMNLGVKTAGYFEEEILEHLKTHGPKLISTIENWIKMSEKELTEDEKLVPGYPLLPLSKGFCLSIIKALKDYKEVLISMNIIFK
ncbi:(E3-independent) E2 ubiquitin-conjugating enzyme UBE2O-like [Metopolophium dirhodum]|uniref:(E3-independent) E2 ubiquitin-conjugating enzyme UBE2O-like n=1 Tax=Metopolophium dirhodum TaxID=44670 RepID=UPI00298F8BC7|nr:(E3-independent) E2 ubiquitin-conjugating enzyme UBE2O-like [Metopolophium dirhodum]